jgi:capsular polysaccharide biosynthesis protein
VSQASPSMRLHRHTEVPHDVALVVPDRSYACHGPPRLFNYLTRDPKALSWFPAEILRTTVDCPDEYVIRIRDAHVVHGHYLIQYPARPLADTFNFENSAVDRPEISEIGQQILRGEVHRHTANDLPIFHIFKDVYCNYGHMLVEVLPKLLHIKAMGVGRFTMLFPWSSLMFLPAVQFAADALGLSFEHVVCFNNQIVRVDEVLWVGPIAQHDRRKSQTLRDLAGLLTAAVPTSGLPRRLYVTRPAGAIRPIANQAELEGLARAHGYHVVEPATLSFPEQISLFHGADHVLGPMGAALTNTVFMRPGTRVSMFTNRRIDPFYYDIARLMGLEFDWVFTQDGEAWTNVMQTEPWHIDGARFAGLLPWLD